VGRVDPSGLQEYREERLTESEQGDPVAEAEIREADAEAIGAGVSRPSFLRAPGAGATAAEAAYARAMVSTERAAQRGANQCPLPRFIDRNAHAKGRRAYWEARAKFNPEAYGPNDLA